MIFRKILPIVAIFPILLALVLFLSAPARYSACVSEGISLWAVSVLPATFPFLFLTALLSGTKPFSAVARRLSPLTRKIFRVSGTGGCLFVLSALSGYPVGAKSLADCYRNGQIGDGEKFRLACLCSTSGPMFVVGVVGSAMFKSAALGWVMLLSHFLGVLIVCFAMRFFARGRASEQICFKPHTGGSPSDTLLSSVLSVLCVGGAIALFACFGQMLADLFRLPEGTLVCAVVRGLCEMTTGCAILAQTPSPFSLALGCFFVTFGGFCVHLQQLAFLAPAKIKPLPFLGVKLLQGVLAGAICFLFGLALF